MENKKIKTFQEFEGDLIAMSMEMTDTIVNFPLTIPEGQIAAFNEPILLSGGGRIVAVGNQLRKNQLRMLHSDVAEEKLGAFAPFSPIELMGVIGRLEEKLYSIQPE